MRQPRFNTGTITLLVLALVVGVVGGVFFERMVLYPTATTLTVPTGSRDAFRLVAEVWNLIDRKYFNQEGINPEQMAYSAAEGLVQTLGDVGHTRFLRPEMAKRHKQQLQGAFEGIGAYVEKREGQIVIVAPIDDSPAQQAGLEPGDVIRQVNGKAVEGLSLTEVVDRVAGPAGSEVTLTILDPDTGEQRTVTLERAKIELDLVTWQRLPGTETAYLRISSFSKGATKDLARTLDEIQSEEGITGIVLDLRNNPGGLLSEAVGVASHFIEEGVVLQRRGAQGELSEVTVEADVDAVEIPLAVLANQGSASSAEVVIGALQDHGRAKMVGVTTFGAGTVLNQFDLPSGAILLLATEEWLTPDGRVIWQKGLSPDIKVTLPKGVAPLMRFRLEDITAEALQNSQDRQLLRALALLDGADSQ